MKKVLLIMTMLASVMFAKAQNDTVFYVNNMETIVNVCTNKYDTVLIYAAEDCTDFLWLIEGIEFSGNPIIITPEMCLIGTNSCHIEYAGCDHSYSRAVHFIEPNVPNETYQEIWIHSGELAELKAVADDSASMYNFHWNTGEDENTIYKPAGTYIAGISDMCATAYRTKIVRENVELYRATVDLETNLNKATWQVTAVQAEYISEVKIYRDGLLVGTAPYEQGYFLDAIGSDNAARNYHLVGVTNEGEECPIASYQKGTIHTTYYQDVNNDLNMTWNIPYVEEGAQGTLTYFQICKYDPNTGELTVVDQVNSSITDYTCGVNQFDGGYAVIAAVFNDNKGFEELSFSNLTTDILGVGENGGPSTGSGTLTVYPIPTEDRVTIEGTGTAIITNALGQTVWTKEIDGKVTIELPQGMYFVKLNGATQKIVVE